MPSSDIYLLVCNRQKSAYRSVSWLQRKRINYRLSSAGALIDCDSVESQIHNVKCIIETFAEDLLKVDLSHISAIDVVKGDLMSVYNLVEILDGMLEYLLEKGTSESDSGGKIGNLSLYIFTSVNKYFSF